MSAHRQDAVVRARYWVLGGWALLLMTLALARESWPAGDWAFFYEGFGLLLHGTVHLPAPWSAVHYSGGGLRLYALHPQFQIGPLALLAGGVVEAMDRVNPYFGPTVVVLAGLFVIRGLERLAVNLSDNDERRVHTVVLVGGALFMYAWVQAFIQCWHLDDLLVLAGVTVALSAVARRNPWLLGAAIGLSIDAKPTAFVILPLLLALNWRENVKALTIAATLIGACWLPFVFADLATLHAGGPQTPIHLGSGLTALGFASSLSSTAPSGIRLAQLVITVLAGGLAVRRGRWYLVPLIGFGLRTAIEPEVASYYAISVIFGALLADLVESRRWLTATLLTWLAFSEPFAFPGDSYWPALGPKAQAWLRFGVPVALTVVALARRNRPAEPKDSPPLSGRLPADEASALVATA